MKRALKLCLSLAVLFVAVRVHAAGFEMNATVQTELDKMKGLIASWAADPVIVVAVKEQNGKGPIQGMDNSKWKTIPRSDSLIKGFQANPAGRYLKAKLDGSGGSFTEAFLNAAGGEKVAFVEKTTSYIHKGSAKFDVPYGGKKSWQGKPEFDESAQTYQIQISVPVVGEGRPIGALVVGVNLSYLEKLAKK